MNLGEFFEKKIVVGHGVKNAWRGEQNTVRGAKGGNQNGERDNFARPGAKDLADSSGGDGVAGGHAQGTESEKVSDDSEEIETGKDQGSGEKGAGEVLLGIDDFACAVSSELPAFIGPKNGNHCQTEIRPKAESVPGDAESGRNFAGVMTHGEEHSTEEHDDADLDQRGPVLKIGTLTRAPDVYSGDDQGHHHGSDSLFFGRNRKHLREVFAENTRECSDGTAGNH